MNRRTDLDIVLAVEAARTRATFIGHEYYGHAPFAKRARERSRKRESIDDILLRARANRGKAAWRSDELSSLPTQPQPERAAK